MKAILFDLDGTLLDTLDDLAAAVNAALDAHGHPVRRKEEVRGFVGNGLRRLMELAVPEGTPEEEMQACLAYMRRYYDAHSAEATAPYAGVCGMLQGLQTLGVPMALVSNKPDGPVSALAERYFPGVFAVTVGEVPHRARKPAADMPLYALQRLGVRPEEAVYVGDSEVDVRTARNAGMPVISVTWGFRGREVLEQLGPDALADRPEELLALLQNLYEL